MKRYNRSTGCYKIDIFVNGVYFCSTDQSKTCRAAKARFIELNPNVDANNVKAYFYHE